jgi:tetratricopeptide (TPR) repeat protein
MAAIACLLISPPGWAQYPAAKTVGVRGQIENARLGETLMVELRGGGFDQVPRKATVGPTGDFEFDSVPEGDYQLRVTDFHGNVLREKFLSLSDGYGYLSVRLPRPQVQQPVSGIVSARELQQKVPSKARREFMRAYQELQKQAIQKSIDSLHKAIAVYPSYVAAHNQLGVCYVTLNQFDKAAAAFRKAAEFAPDSPVPKYNLSIALYVLHDYAEAEAAARLALKLDPSLAVTHYLLGMSLHAQRRDGQETLDNLRWAARQFPRARLTAAAILSESGRRREAASELREYLRSSPTLANRPTVESWLAGLQERADPQPLADTRQSKPSPDSRP